MSCINTEEKQNSRIIKRLVLSIIPAQGISAALPAINTLINTFLLGYFLDASVLAALGFTNILTTISSAMGNMLSSGSQIVCGKHLGRGDEKKLNENFNTVMCVSAIIGIILALPVILFSEGTARILGASGDMTSVTADCVKGYAVCLALTPMLNSLITFLQMERMDGIITFSTVVMTIVNLGGNILNIFVFKCGIYGATLSISLGTVAAVTMGIIAIIIKRNMFRFRLGDFSLREAKDVFNSGNAMIINQGCAAVRCRVINHYMYAIGGTVGMSALAVAYNIIESLGAMLEFGVLGADRTVASVLLASRDTFSLRKLQKITADATRYIFIALYALIFITASPVSLLSGATVENVAVYVTVIRYACLYLLICHIYAPAFCMYQATNQIKELNIVSIICNAGLCWLSCFLFAETLGVWFIAFTCTLSNIFYLIGFAVIFTVKAKRLPRSIYETVYIPSLPEAPRENRFKATITSSDSAVDASEKARLFCLEKGLDKRNAYYCALCIEEIAVDTVMYRFNKKNSTIDLRMIYEDGHISIMLRDDCKMFNPKKWLELCSPEDEMRSMGIKTVTKISREMKYINTLGLNVLTIEI